MQTASLALRTGRRAPILRRIMNKADPNAECIEQLRVQFAVRRYCVVLSRNRCHSGKGKACHRYKVLLREWHGLLPHYTLVVIRASWLALACKRLCSMPGCQALDCCCMSAAAPGDRSEQAGPRSGGCERHSRENHTTSVGGRVGKQRQRSDYEGWARLQPSMGRWCLQLGHKRRLTDRSFATCLLNLTAAGPVHFFSGRSSSRLTEAATRMECWGALAHRWQSSG